jgi:hypothetical protein
VKKFCTFLIVLICSFYIGCSVIQRVNGSSLWWLDGKWTGTGFQIESKETWEIEFTSDSKRTLYSIVYPDLDCHGEWRPVSISGYSVTFEEKIKEGDHSCADGGIIVITKVDDNHLSFTYFWKDGELGAFSTLEREN